MHFVGESSWIKINSVEREEKMCIVSMKLMIYDEGCVNWDVIVYMYVMVSKRENEEKLENRPLKTNAV